MANALNDLGTYTQARVRIFEKHIDKRPRGGCWLWTGARDRDGYARSNWNRRHVGGHRIAYMLWVGPIPEGLVIDHRCGVRHCVNPSHLEAVTQRVNIYRDGTPAAFNGTKTHCLHGHELSGDNLKVYPRTINGKPYPMRICLTCKRNNPQGRLTRPPAAKEHR